MTPLGTRKELEDDDGSSMDDHYTDDGYGSNEEYIRFVKTNGALEDAAEEDDDTGRDDLEYRTDMTDFLDDFVNLDSSDASFSGDSGDLEQFLPRHSFIPEQKVLDTKAASALRKSGSNMLMSDQLGTGDLLDDETSAAALLALLGLLAVIVVVSFVSASWHRTMDSVPIVAKKNSGKAEARKIGASPLLKRRDHSQ